jgi:hypothetical protein
MVRLGVFGCWSTTPARNRDDSRFKTTVEAKKFRYLKKSAALEHCVSQSPGANGMMYVRDQDVLLAYDVRGEE